MELQTLHFFRTVAEEGSFSSAADKLGYAQSNLSSRIIQLEKEFDVVLFQRSKKGVTLTEKGELLLDYAVRILDLTAEMEKAVRDTDSMSDVLTFGSMESVASTILPAILTEYHKKYPKMKIIIRTGTTAALMKDLECREIDAAFVAGEAKGEKYISMYIRTEELVLISASAQNEESLGSLLRKKYLVFPVGCSYRRILEELAEKEGVVSGNMIEFHSLSSIISSVRAGLGVSLFPRSAVDLYEKKQELTVHQLPEELRFVDIYFVYRKDGYLTNSLKKFIEQF